MLSRTRYKGMAFSLDDVFKNVRRVASVWPIDFKPENISFGEHPSRRIGDGIDFGRITEFDPMIHDPFRINWLAVNPFDEDELMVRENIENKEADFILACDLSTSMTFSVRDQQHKERMLLEVYGDCALTCLRAQDPAGMVTFANDILFYDLQPRKTEDAIYYNIAQMYEFFSQVRTGGRGKLKRSETDYLCLFEFIRSRYGSRKIYIIVIYDFIGIEKHDPEFIREFMGDHEVSFIYLDDPDEFRVRSNSGYVWNEDIETGEQVMISVDDLSKIEAETRAARSKYRDLCDMQGIHSIVLEYGDNEQLRKYVERLVRFVYIRGASK